MTTQRRQPVPSWWQGTYPEWLAFSTLQSLGKEPNRDFIYSANPEDGVSFRFINPRDLAVNVTGLMHNYESGQDGQSVGFINKQQMIGVGVHLIFIEDVDLQQDANYYINEALAYRDHSHMGG